MPFFQYLYTGGTFTEGNGMGQQNAHQDLVFVVTDVVLLFFINLWMCVFLAIQYFVHCFSTHVWQIS